MTGRRRAAPAGTARPPRSVRTAEELGGRRAERDRERGQTTTEWLMIAGILTAVGIFLLGIVPDAIRVYTLSLISSVRTIAP